ncbi:hypothetical protein PR048_031023 [Dryococelus australis]|uniref:Uncharacterized protein n=1 Tax=Dryococelus australis TaxID=614101 RepID=A0ABQ9G456_9NEOP|nr:hypothetical protein PR048_031023 [Dryococelus australis]
MKGRGKREIPEKTRPPTASSGTIPTCENPVTRPGIEPGASPNVQHRSDQQSRFREHVLHKFLKVRYQWRFAADVAGASLVSTLAMFYFAPTSPASQQEMTLMISPFSAEATWNGDEPHTWQQMDVPHACTPERGCSTGHEHHMSVLALVDAAGLLASHTALSPSLLESLITLLLRRTCCSSKHDNQFRVWLLAYRLRHSAEQLITSLPYPTPRIPPKWGIFRCVFGAANFNGQECIFKRVFALVIKPVRGETAAYTTNSSGTCLQNGFTVRQSARENLPTHTLEIPSEHVVANQTEDPFPELHTANQRMSSVNFSKVRVSTLGHSGSAEQRGPAQSTLYEVHTRVKTSLDARRTQRHSSDRSAVALELTRIPPLEFNPSGQAPAFRRKSDYVSNLKRGNGRYTRKPADQWHRLTRSPLEENPGVVRPGIETSSPWWEAGSLTAQPPRPPCEIYYFGNVLRDQLVPLTESCDINPEDTAARDVVAACGIWTPDTVARSDPHFKYVPANIPCKNDATATEQEVMLQVLGITKLPELYAIHGKVRSLRSRTPYTPSHPSRKCDPGSACDCQFFGTKARWHQLPSCVSIGRTQPTTPSLPNLPPLTQHPSPERCVLWSLACLHSIVNFSALRQDGDNCLLALRSGAATPPFPHPSEPALLQHAYNPLHLPATSCLQGPGGHSPICPQLSFLATESRWRQLPTCAQIGSCSAVDIPHPPPSEQARV